MTDKHRLKEYLTLVDQLTNVATKDDLAECARLLAMTVAHYESVYGRLSPDDIQEMTLGEEHSQIQIDVMTNAMETMVGMLGGIVQGFDEKQPH